MKIGKAEDLSDDKQKENTKDIIRTRTSKNKPENVVEVKSNGEREQNKRK